METLFRTVVVAGDQPLQHVRTTVGGGFVLIAADLNDLFTRLEDVDRHVFNELNARRHEVVMHVPPAAPVTLHFEPGERLSVVSWANVNDVYTLTRGLEEGHLNGGW
jgi:hypothetical protein